MQRISIVGTSGSGKSTLARAMSRTLSLPIVELDALHWLPDWTARDRGEFAALVTEQIAADAWIADGGYNRIRPAVLARADTVNFLDYGRARTRRWLKSLTP